MTPTEHPDSIVPVEPRRRWEQIQSAFAIAAELPQDQQRSKVRELCEDDGRMIEEVMDLLEEDAIEQPLLDAKLSRLAEDALQSHHVRSLVLQQIGPYRILRLLGEGGMGVVYLAERTDIGGLVAIKLLRDAWMSPMRRKRFEAEQRMLAQMNHPAIARIYDAGTMEDGTPWFVMEFSDGRAFTTYLRNTQADVRTSLLLFRKVCEAVRYAHSRAIIHRDLKPSNILVNAAGEVKLLDFGIAKNLESEESRAARTVLELRLMTPAYAAPEQRSGGQLGVFTDVYALGVLLYEILSGELPAADRENRPPEKPSVVAGLSSFGSHLSKREWADLDVLCLTALQWDPERRYRSVDALMRDVSAYLENRVLEARPDSALYASGKFIERNRAALLSVAMGLLLLVAASVVFLARLKHARDAALAESARTAQVLRFTESLFNGGDSYAGPAADLKVVQLLARGQKEAESLNADPRVQSDMFALLGGVYQKLDQLGPAQDLLQRAMEERKRYLGEQDADYAKSLVDLGLLRREQGRMDEGEPLLRQALALEQKAKPKDDSALERTHLALGSLLTDRGRYPEARQELEGAVAVGQKTAPAEEYAKELTALADVEFYLGKYPESEGLNRKAMALKISARGSQHPSVADNLNNLGNIAQNRGHYFEAEGYLQQAIAIDEAWYGPNHPEVAHNLTALSQSLILEKRYDDAKATLERALAIQRHTFGETHSSVATAFNQLGILAYTRERYDEAEIDFRNALAIWLKVYGPQHQFIGLCYANLAGVYMYRKQYALAEEMSHKALAVYGSSLTDNHLSTAVIHLKLGRILMRQSKFAEAESESTKAYDYLSAHRDSKDSYLLGVRKDLATIEKELGKPNQAAQYEVASR